MDFHDTEVQRIGRDLENYVAKRFAEATGFKVRRSNFMYRSMKYPFMIADVDRLLVGEEAGLECKTANAFQAEQWKNGHVPLHYLMQVFHYMAVTGFKVWYLAVLILGQEFKYVKITWKEEMIRKLVQIEERFWTQHVLTGILPSPDDSEAFTKLWSNITEP